MKPFLFAMMLLMVSTTSFSQQANSSLSMPDQDYLTKSKNQKTTAWILLGGGGVLFFTGIVLPLGEPIDPNDPNKGYKNGGTRVLLVTTGTLSMLTSIPLFIASSKNKRKGMSLSFKNEQVSQIQKNSLVYQTIPSLNLKINL